MAKSTNTKTTKSSKKSTEAVRSRKSNNAAKKSTRTAKVTVSRTAEMPAENLNFLAAVLMMIGVLIMLSAVVGFGAFASDTEIRTVLSGPERSAVLALYLCSGALFVVASIAMFRHRYAAKLWTKLASVAITASQVVAVIAVLVRFMNNCVGKNNCGSARAVFESQGALFLILAVAFFCLSVIAWLYLDTADHVDAALTVGRKGPGGDH